MFSKSTILTTRLSSMAIAFTMTLAMLMSINMLATGEAHADSLASTVPVAAECVQV